MGLHFCVTVQDCGVQEPLVAEWPVIPTDRADHAGEPISLLVLIK